MVEITHDWDNEDYVATLDQAWAEYRRACYGDRDLPAQQVNETQQAFFSGIAWLAGRDSYCPDDLMSALRTVVGRINPLVLRHQQPDAKPQGE